MCIRDRACIALHASGGLIAGMDTGIFHLQPADDGTLACTLISAVQHPQAGMRFNDGRCDRQGRFWAGTMVRDMSLAQPAGGLYRQDARGLSTPLIEGLAAKYAKGDTQGFIDYRNNQVPMKHMGTGWDTAHAVLFLVADESRYVTGTEIVVDGGLVAATR